MKDIYCLLEIHVVKIESTCPQASFKPVYAHFSASAHSQRGDVNSTERLLVQMLMKHVKTPA